MTVNENFHDASATIATTRDSNFCAVSDFYKFENKKKSQMGPIFLQFRVAMAL